ncbi:cytochrome P450 [Sphaerisporangium rufum]|uniref:Cytochrome P450 n=1 Tax=Sphaerisporangium rufum TaxID=1381558 RepID=A0A919V4C8_9ACTN|nr:cytochrome P450 [Sphaerisporangium rufum]GII77130.1 cytochrome P450 [Sphaerisporangium rufum]
MAVARPAGPVIDVFDPRVYAAGIPHDAYRLLRDEDPVHWHQEPAVGDWPAGPGFWAVTRYADVVRVLRTPGEYSSFAGATQIRDPDPADLPFIRRMMLNLDPPDHGRLRRVVSGAFTPRRIGRFADAVAARARELVDRVAERGTCDLPVDVTDEYPVANLADLLGVPPGDRGLIRAWTDRVVGYQDPDHAGTARGPDGRPVNPRSPARLADMFDYARALAEHKRRRPADDLMTALALAEEDGRRLDDAELSMFFFLLVIAGNDTVRAALPGGLAVLLDHPAEHRRLLADPGLLDPAIEELLRRHPPVLSFRRTAVADTVLAGRPIAAGDKVVVFHAAANHDERRFPDPMRLDIARRLNDHVSFGDGPHVCLGARFARLQMRALYRELLWRLPDLEPAGPPVRLVSNFIGGVKHLPLRFTPVPRSGAR